MSTTDTEGLYKTWKGSIADTAGLLQNFKYPIAMVSRGDTNTATFKSIKMWCEFKLPLYSDNGDGTLTVNIDPKDYPDIIGDRITAIVAYYAEDNQLLSLDIRTVSELTRKTSIKNFNINKTAGAKGKYSSGMDI